MKRVTENRVVINNVSCWTGCKVALDWIKGKKKTWKPWVENRLIVIRKEVERKNWMHIEGLGNSADIPICMFCFKQLSDSWLSGNKFLYKDEV